MKELDHILKAVRNLVWFALSLSALVVLILMLRLGYIQLPVEEIPVEAAVVEAVSEELPGEIGSLDTESGLIVDIGFTVVKAQCGACHSTKLVAQNAFSREGWTEVIRWMQEKQNLWDLGEQEAVVLDYLEKNYAPKNMGRRKNLENIDWYELTD